MGIALLSLFAAYYASVTLFTHIHIVNGCTIVHSHPFSDKNHSHTVDQVITIAHLSVLQTLEPVAVAEVEAMLPDHGEIECLETVSKALASVAPCIGLRAPPFSCL